MAYNVEWPNAENHQVLPNLYLGGHVWREEGVTKFAKDSSVSQDKSWDYVVSAFLEEDFECIPRCDTRLVLFHDTEAGLGEDTWERIKSVVDEMTVRWLAGQKILIRCQAGFNRSGLLTSLVLMSLGFTAEGAINMVRSRRGKSVLVNPAFERYVREREKEYRNKDNYDMTEVVAGDWMDLVL